MHRCIAGRSGRPEPRRRGHWTISGNCPVRWSARADGRTALRPCSGGDAAPDGVKHLLSTYVWDADLVRVDLRDYAVEHLDNPARVLVVDETGFLKRGEKPIGAKMVRLVPAHHAVDAGPCLPGGGAAPRLETGRKEGHYDLNEEFSSLTVSEVRRRLARLVWTDSQPYDFVLYWSGWIRRHQARAQQCHYRRRLSLLNPVVRL